MSKHIIQRKMCLASKSEGRKSLLQAAGINFDTLPANINEAIDIENPTLLVTKLAKAKAKAILSKTDADIIIGADTIVELNKKIFGKPIDRDDSINMLLELQDHTHQLITGLCVIKKATQEILTCSVITQVNFSKLSITRIKEYIDFYKPYSFAGAYAMDSISSWFITEINGSPSNVTGLPMVELRSLVENLGYSWFEFVTNR